MKTINVMSESVHETIKAWRGKATQVEAASLLGVSLRTYQHWEQGRVPNPSTIALLMLIIRYVKPGTRNY